MNDLLNVLISGVITFSLLSCEKEKIIIPDISNMPVIDRHGVVDGFGYKQDNKKVIQFLYAGAFLNDVLKKTPQKKIDRIIEENPDWEFLIFVRSTSETIPVLVKYLDKYDCDFPVIIDTADVFAQVNNCKWTAIGYICDEKNHWLGTSVIGTPMSFFDSEFARVKQELR